MCGIAGIYSEKGKINSDILKDMAKALSHRGPDGEGFYISVNVGLAHRRLSIIDLSESGKQPMSNEDETLWLVFNGEIYNYMELREDLINLGHKFHSKTDSEVIIHAYEEWGSDCTKHFNGMWAFALYDNKNDEMFCSRDRFGIKPFYYSLIDGEFIFASEIKALLKHPKAGVIPNDRKVLLYLGNAVQDTDEETMFEGIFQLRPASSMYIKKGIPEKPFTYWEYEVSPLKLSSPDFSDENASEELLFKIIDSVKIRLRSDVPVGTCLSGGLDSSTIVSLINNIIKKEGIKSVGDRQNTFSVCFEDKRYDESEYIDEVINSTGVSAHKIYPLAEELESDLNRIIYMQDEPFGSLSIYAQYKVMKLAGKNVKVILDGQGADEQLAGYLGYQTAYIKSLKGNIPHFLSEIYGSFRLHRTFFISAITQLSARKKRRKLLKGDIPVINRYDGTLDLVLKSEVTKSNLQALLHYEDRNSMAFSIESRVPFLDYRLVEYIGLLPLDQKIRRGVTKYVLRKAIKGIVPEKVRCRMDKMGFVTPEEIWMANELSDLATGIFNSESFKRRKYWYADRVLENYNRFLKGKSEYSGDFWRIMCTEMWMRIFFDNRKNI
ncbi:asparagine synthase (glutamine-hydrolyzing) [Methanoplanus sp. FWC-SCC4]|uniref:Putative asparagine synthetase [glutamine-hydrolyzing] n=1 Tax=Methanochimaera problematica TaxID=2609417 RepID=A0AA97FGV4_9EURY|nr:asparagine synthase (glutamine-hydrolyzing) [Methanoplanus sp. FWC-SCC4]WOF17196.1 asparagine synthase (glutamine-hydrolyzing) [Methanoplanus sp. FWC-SCC4]